MPGGMATKVIAHPMAYRDAVHYAVTGGRFDGGATAGIRFLNRAASCPASVFGWERD